MSSSLAGEQERLEARAEAVLAGVPSFVWDGESLPVPVEDIADSCFGLLIRSEPDPSLAPGAPQLPAGQALSGLLLADRGEIWVNAEEAREWPGRRRFTIGHELGHWVLHRPVPEPQHAAGQESVFCRRGAVCEDCDRDALATAHSGIPVAEQEANVFAAALLMPARLVGEHYDRSQPDYFERLCRLFEVSGAAMGRRLHSAVPRQR